MRGGRLGGLFALTLLPSLLHVVLTVLLSTPASSALLKPSFSSRAVGLPQAEAGKDASGRLALKRVSARSLPKAKRAPSSEEALLAQRVQRLTGTEEAVQEQRAALQMQREDPKAEVNFLAQIGQLEGQLEATRSTVFTLQDQLAKEETVSVKQLRSLRGQLAQAQKANQDAERRAWHWELGFFATQFLSALVVFFLALFFWRCATQGCQGGCCGAPCPMTESLLEGAEGSMLSVGGKRTWAPFGTADGGAVAHRPMDPQLREKLNRRRLMAEGQPVPQVKMGLSSAPSSDATAPQISPRCEYFHMGEEGEEEVGSPNSPRHVAHSFDFPSDFAQVDGAPRPPLAAAH